MLLETKTNQTGRATGPSFFCQVTPSTSADEQPIVVVNLVPPVILFPDDFCLGVLPVQKGGDYDYDDDYDDNY